MATILKNAGQVTAAAAMKAERARDAARAMQEYEAEKIAVRARTARLRSLRLAAEAENRQRAKAILANKKRQSSKT
jgi:hypothetical protein